MEQAREEVQVQELVGSSRPVRDIIKHVEMYKNPASFFKSTIQHLSKYVSDEQTVTDQVKLTTTRSTTISRLGVLQTRFPKTAYQPFKQHMVLRKQNNS